MPDTDGLLLLKKPAGTTSFTALNLVKKKLNTKKVGHTGTLDKFAEGLLVVLSGKFTRLAPYITDLDKTYRAVFEFGKETSTLDPEGTVVRTAEIPSIEVMTEKQPSFLGMIRQRPPLFSAVHIAGKRAYERALLGEDVEIPVRNVHIREFALLDWKPPYLQVRVKCGKGTYIRSLARDFAEACGSCAYVSALERTAVGPFELRDAVAPEDFDPRVWLRRGSAALKALYADRILIVEENHLADIQSGKTVTEKFFKNPPEEKGSFIVFSSDDKLVAFITLGDEGFRYRFVAA